MREICIRNTRSFRCFQIDIRWEGEDLLEKGVIQYDGNEYTVIEVSQKHFRPAEVDFLLGDSTKAFNRLGWKPEYSFEALVHEMAMYDYQNPDSRV